MASIPDYDAPPPQGGYQRTPPYSMEAEISVIGSMLLSSDAIADVSETIGPDDFYRGAHRTLFEVMVDLYDRGEPVDSVTVADELERRGKLDDVGGALAIADISAQVPTPANAAYYAKIVNDRALKRRLINAATTLTQLGFDVEKSGVDAVDEAESHVFDLANRQRRGEFVPMRELLSEAFDLIEKLHESDSTITGLETGFTDFDQLTSGLQPGQLVILAARPAMGKCLSGSTRVWDASSGQMVPISTLVSQGAQGMSVWAHDFDEVRAEAAPITNVFDNGIREVVRVVTKSGRSFTATPNHRVRTVNGWVEVQDLELGVDGIAIPTRLPEPEDARRIKPEEVRLLAYLLGDGSTSSSAGSNPQFTNTGPEALADFIRCARALGDDVLADRRPLTAALAETHGLRCLAVDKRVPDAVFSLPNDQLAEFIGALWATAGWITQPGVGAPEIGFAPASEGLARDVAHLLLRFGIVARIDAKPNDQAGSWTITVRDGDQIRRFAATFDVPDKQDKARRLAAHVTSRALGDAPLMAMGDAEVGWDTVVSVEPAGRERTFDIEVDPHHNFVADDVVLHNSTLVTNMITNVAAGQRKPAAIFSLEMGQMEIVQRMLSAEAKLDADRLRTGKLRHDDWPKLSKAMGKLSEAPLFIDDTPGITMMEIRSKCRRIAQRHGLSLIVVDYLQLMESHKRSEGRVQEVAEFSRGLKVLAKEIGCPVIALSQLSRKPEERTDRRPLLSDLRESGAIEQDADIVGFIYRDEVYNPDTEAKGEAELIIAKHRAGRLATVRLSFLGHHSRFANIARTPGPPGGYGAPPARAPEPSQAGGAI